MKDQIQFDLLIKKSLDNKSHEIDVSDNMPERVKAAINYDMSKSSVQRFMNRAATVGLFSRKQAAAAMLLLIFSMAAVYNFNPQVKAWAQKQINQIINTIEITLSGDGSHIKSSEKIITAGDETIHVSTEERAYENDDIPDVDIKEVEAVAGFKVKLPDYLPESLNLPDKVSVLDYNYSWVSLNEDGSDYIVDTTDSDLAKEIMNDMAINAKARNVKIKLNDAKNEFDGLCLFTVSNGQFINIYGNQGKLINILDKTATLYENDVTLNNESQNETKKVTERILEWQDGDIHYRIDDYSGLGADELIKIAESIIKKL